MKLGRFGTVSLALAGLLLASPALPAKDGGACKADVEKYCKNVEKGGGRIKQCLSDHKADLSTECRTKIERHEQRKAACKGDVEKFCKDIPRGKGQIKACMKSHENELSPACKALI